MPHYFFLWDDSEGGNVDHIALHGVDCDTCEDVVQAASRPYELSRSSGHPIVFGEAADGRSVAVIFEIIDEDTIYVITAYEVEG